MLAPALSKNRSLLGLHVAGNEMYLDAKGFLHATPIHSKKEAAFKPPAGEEEEEGAGGKGGRGGRGKGKSKRQGRSPTKKQRRTESHGRGSPTLRQRQRRSPQTGSRGGAGAEDEGQEVMGSSTKDHNMFMTQTAGVGGHTNHRIVAGIAELQTRDKVRSEA